MCWLAWENRFDTLDGDLATALLVILAVKEGEFAAGFAGAEEKGL